MNFEDVKSIVDTPGVYRVAMKDYDDKYIIEYQTKHDIIRMKCTCKTHSEAASYVTNDYGYPEMESPGSEFDEIDKITYIAYSDENDDMKELNFTEEQKEELSYLIDIS